MTQPDAQGDEGYTHLSDDRLLDALLAGSSITAAARQADVSRETATRRMRDPGFRRRLQEARAEVRRATLDRLSLATTAAVGQLVSTMASPTVPASVKVRAAATILSEGRAWAAVGEFATRLEALEHALAGRVAPDLSGIYRMLEDALVDLDPRGTE